jgi:glutamine cyclotransferase
MLDLPKSIKEGWGITNNENELIISDGSDSIYFVNGDLNNFVVKRSIQVKNSSTNKRYTYLNELEYAYDLIFSNVWMTNKIIIIDPKTGNDIKYYSILIIFRDIDFTPLVNYENKIKGDKMIDVLNGIAYDKVNDAFYITGKLWTNIYYVKFKVKF